MNNTLEYLFNQLHITSDKLEYSAIHSKDEIHYIARIINRLNHYLTMNKDVVLEENCIEQLKDMLKLNLSTLKFLKNIITSTEIVCKHLQKKIDDETSKIKGKQ